MTECTSGCGCVSSDRTALHLRLSGVVDLEQYQRASTDLRDIIENRYYLGSHLDRDELHIEPDQDEVARNALLS